MAVSWREHRAPEGTVHMTTGCSPDGVEKETPEGVVRLRGSDPRGDRGSAVRQVAEREPGAVVGLIELLGADVVRAGDARREHALGAQPVLRIPRLTRDPREARRLHVRQVWRGRLPADVR